MAHLEGVSCTCGALVCDSRPQALPFSLPLPFTQAQKKIRFGGPVGVLGLQTRLDLVKELGRANVPAAALGRCLCVHQLGNPKLWERDKAVDPV